MIISFYDKNFRGLQDNASLVIDSKSYSLIKRGVDLDELKCICEPFTESIQPTFLVVKNDIGNYVYGCLAGIPELTNERKTVITGTDLKTMLKSDIIASFSSLSLTTVNTLFNYVFGIWNTQVNQSSFDCQLVYTGNVGTISLTDLKHEGKSKYNAWDDIFAPYLKYYGLYMTTRLDLINKKVIFTVGKSMHRDLNVKLWEHGIYDYGKWVANVNETQGYVRDKSTNSFIDSGYKWILRSDNAIMAVKKFNISTEYNMGEFVTYEDVIYRSLFGNNTGNTPSAISSYWERVERDIYPIKRKIVLKETEETNKVLELLSEANTEALQLLCDSMYNEDIILSGVDADFETRFNITIRKGEQVYKSLPCGELRYDASGLKSVQIGYRFTGLQFIL